jgi:membrane protein DedA with SNARE-associated domain/rhodanese-related sulfurtransferase
VRALIEFVVRHGYVVLIAWVFVEQAGLPIPSMPILLAAGALAGDGRMSLPAALICAVLAAMAADAIWFQLGRLKGVQVLRALCKISLEPDSCVRRTEDIFARRGARTLLFAKFVPGLNAVATPLAGVIDMRPWRFLLFDALGSLLWAGSFLTLGYAFSDQIEAVAAHAARTGSLAVAIVGGAIVSYVAYKLMARRRFLRELSIARIGADDLKARIDAGEPLVIVDLRHALEFDADPETIPGALRIDAETLEQDRGRLPDDREVVLFCTCPNEATSARVALLLKSRGARRIRPLEGGLTGWRKRGYPIERIVPGGITS